MMSVLFYFPFTSYYSLKNFFGLRY